jgi:hypothetical protein
MEENYQGYNQPEYENDDPRKGANKSILGYRIDRVDGELRDLRAGITAPSYDYGQHHKH